MILRFASAAAAIALTACSGAGTPDAARTPTPSPIPTRLAVPTMEVRSLSRRPPSESLGRYRAVKLTDANYPGGLAVAPDGRIFFSELYGGKIRVVDRRGRLDPAPWFDVNAEYGIRWEKFFHGGLTGLAFDPEFERNGFVYAVTQVPDEKTELPEKTLVLRLRERGGRGTAPKVLLEIPAGKFDNVYSLVFGPDGMLYVPSGQNRNRKRSADPLDDLLGKILRIAPDGTAPGDNPFGDRAPLVYAMGIRNAFDVAFDPASGFILAGENGTTDHDEINLVMPGHDYGWPRHRGIVDREGITNPLLDYRGDRVAPVGIAYYDGGEHPRLRGRFLMCTNHPSEGTLLALRLEVRNGRARLARMTKIADTCVVDVAVAPDGAVYFSDASAIYRLEAA